MSPDQEVEYRNTRSLVQDAMRRNDPAALDVAVSLYKAALADIRKDIPTKEPAHG